MFRNVKYTFFLPIFFLLHSGTPVGFVEYSEILSTSENEMITIALEKPVYNKFCKDYRLIK